MRIQDGPQEDQYSQTVFDEYEPLPDPAETTDEGDEENDPGNILDPTQNDNEALPIPTMDNNLQADDSSNNFWAVASAFGDIAFGGFFTSLSVYALVASCVYAGPACLITAPIFFTTAVIGAQVFVNGFQSFRQMNDSSIEPTGREVIDLVFPFLKKRGK